MITLTLEEDDLMLEDASVVIDHSSNSLDSDYDGLSRILTVSVQNNDGCIQVGADSKADFSGGTYGSGTNSDPYLICNAMQLQSMRDDLFAFYELGQDIDVSSITGPYSCNGTCTGFQPIGTNANRFNGTLDGKGFAISGLTININLTSGNSYAGLFGRISFTNIRNIGLLNVNISSSSRSYAGGLAGENVGTTSISNSYSTGNIFSTAFSTSYTGGLVAQNSSSIINSYATGNVSSSNFTSYAGGLVAQNSSSSITNSYSTGNIFSTAFSTSYTGGLVAQNTSSSIINSYSTGNVSSSSALSSYAGGSVGQNSGTSSIINSYSTGDVSSFFSSSSSGTGGLVGQNTSSGSIITNSYYDQDTTTLFENGSEVSDTAVDRNNGTLTCVGGFSTSEFIVPMAPNTGSCSPLAIFFNWQTLFHIDNADRDDNLTTGTDESSVHYDSNDDGNITNTDAFLWNFGISSEYPFIASTTGTADEQAVRMASGFLQFSNTTLGRPSTTDPVFFYDITDTAMDITTSGTVVQGTAANVYEIQDAVDASGDALATPPTVTNAGVINGVNPLAAGAEFYLKVTFTKGASPNTASFTRRYRFKK